LNLFDANARVDYDQPERFAEVVKSFLRSLAAA